MRYSLLAVIACRRRALKILDRPSLGSSSTQLDGMVAFIGCLDKARAIRGSLAGRKPRYCLSAIFRAKSRSRPFPFYEELFHSRIFVMATALASAGPSLKIYNENFAVVRDILPLDLKAAVDDVSYADTTAHTCCSP